MELKEKLDEISNNSLDIFFEEFRTCLDKCAPLKEKKNRLNKSIFMTKKKFKKSYHAKIPVKEEF